MREKYCWLAGGWKLVLERCERKTLLGWRLLELPNRVNKIEQGRAWDLKKADQDIPRNQRKLEEKATREI